MKPYLLNDVPEDLWEALRRDAQSREVPDVFENEEGRKYPNRRTERTGTSLNNVVNEILAARYGLEFEPTNRATFAYDRLPMMRSLYLRMPKDINDAVVGEASEQGSKRMAILNALAAHYMLSLPDRTPTVRPKKKHGRPRGRKGRVRT